MIKTGDVQTTQLKLENISKSFGDLKVIKEIDLSLQLGQSLAIIGPSGCGKSTLLEIITGIEKSDAGSVNLGTGRLSYMSQSNHLLPWKRLTENVMLPLQFSGISKVEARKQVEDLLPFFGLGDFKRAYPSQLSGGMQQRAALLRAVINKPSLLLLDEPFAKLDALTKRKLYVWFKELMQSMASSYVFVTHDIDEAMILANRVLVLSQRPASVLLDIDISTEKNRLVSDPLEFTDHHLLQGDLAQVKEKILLALDQ